MDHSISSESIEFIKWFELTFYSFKFINCSIESTGKGPSSWLWELWQLWHFVWYNLIFIFKLEIYENLKAAWKANSGRHGWVYDGQKMQPIHQPYELKIVLQEVQPEISETLQHERSFKNPFQRGAFFVQALW